MAFAAARMIMKEKRPVVVHSRRSTKDERSRSRSKIGSGGGSASSGVLHALEESSQRDHDMHAGVISRNLARVKPVEGVSVPKTPTLVPKNNQNNHQGKKGEKPPPKGPSAQKAPPKQKLPPPKNGKKPKKGQRHPTYDLLVSIDLRECGLSEDQVAEFKEAFMLFDKDEDGVVSLQELAVVLRALGMRPTDVELETMVGGLDADGNGGIEFNDFLQAMGKKQKEEEGEEGLKEAFKVFDKDGDGLISCAELRAVMSSLGEKLSPDEVEEMLREATANSPTGDVNYVDFVSTISKN